jgi:sugar phosphate isomerase/epimerase
MRFGAPALMPASLVSNSSSASPEQLLQMVMKFNYRSMVESLVERGIRLVELASDLPVFLPQVASPSSIADLRQIAEQESITYTVHLPLWSVEPATPLDAVRKASALATVQAIQTFEPLCPERYVYHATGPLAAEFYTRNLPEPARSLIMYQFMDYARRSIEEILTQTQIDSRRLAIETITFPFEMTVRLAMEMGVSLCFDTGHVLAGFSGPVEFFAALEDAMPILGEVHLHDSLAQGPEHIMRHGEDHRALGEGDLDLARLLNTLEQAGWTGPIVIELPQVEEVEQSLEVIRQLRPEHMGILEAASISG